MPMAQFVLCAGAIRRHSALSTGADEYMALSAPYPYVQTNIAETVVSVKQPESLTPKVLAGLGERVTSIMRGMGSVSGARRRVGTAISSRWSDTQQQSPLVKWIAATGEWLNDLALQSKARFLRGPRRPMLRPNCAPLRCFCDGMEQTCVAAGHIQTVEADRLFIFTAVQPSLMSQASDR
jgi:hypothetical protein